MSDALRAALVAVSNSLMLMTFSLTTVAEAQPYGPGQGGMMGGDGGWGMGYGMGYEGIGVLVLALLTLLILGIAAVAFPRRSP